MKIINQSAEFLDKPNWDNVIKHLELCGRVCYKSENKISTNSAQTFIKNIIKHGHEAVLEHFSFSVKFICDRGISHEIVRHRLASYCQESTRYCNYTDDKFKNQICFIKPYFLDENNKSYQIWLNSCTQAEQAYFNLIKNGAKPQEARAVLPNSLKTELIMTANIREWRHFIKLRSSSAAHPQIRELIYALLHICDYKNNVLFQDLI